MKGQMTTDSLDSIFICLNGIKSESLTKRVVSLGMCV